MIDSVRRAAAFAPGHITGFFQIRDEAREPAKRGSRGAGVCTSLGARSVAAVGPAESMSIVVRIDREAVSAPVTLSAVTDVLRAAVRDGKIDLNREAEKGRRARCAVEIDTSLDLPAGQGFGMSAAGALSAALATARAVGLARSVAIEAAHAAEIEHRTGLGDVAGAITGGFEIRTSPGIPPWGATTRFLGYGELVLAVVGPPISTRDVLSDPHRREAVNAAGGKLVEELAAAPSLEKFFALSRRFAEDSGLATPEVRGALAACDRVPDAVSSMSMLGSSVFAIGRADRLEAALAPLGEVWRCEVDAAGARLLELA